MDLLIISPILVLLAFSALALYFLLRPAPAGENRFGAPATSKNFGAAISSFFANYTNFQGRASRSEFWYATLFNVLVSLILVTIDKTEALDLIWSLVIIIPSISLAARRLHDLNRSGWHQLLGLIAPIGTIGIIIWYCLPAKDAAGAVTADRGRDPALHLKTIEALERLAKLRDDGVLTAQEYEFEKRRILGGV